MRQSQFPQFGRTSAVGQESADPARVSPGHLASQMQNLPTAKGADDRDAVDGHEDHEGEELGNMFFWMITG